MRLSNRRGGKKAVGSGVGRRRRVRAAEPTGNRGEWAEILVALKIPLGGGRIPVQGLDGNLIKGAFLIAEGMIFRRGKKTSTLRIDHRGKTVYRLGEGGEVEETWSLQRVSRACKCLINATNTSKDATFAVKGGRGILNFLGLDSVQAGNCEKSDISLLVRDKNTGQEGEIGFSVKSSAGQASSFFNSSQSTNFIFRVTRLNSRDISAINRIKTGKKVRKRMQEIKRRGGRMSYVDVSNPIFKKNLTMICGWLPEMLAEMVRLYSEGKGSSMRDLAAALANDPVCQKKFGLSEKGYIYKLKQLLRACVLGMTAGKEWDGSVAVRGGVLLVGKQGELRCILLNNSEELVDFLYNNAKLDTPSTGRVKCAKIEEKGRRAFMRLGLQIRSRR